MAKMNTQPNVLLPLALMALFALMIPIISIANSHQKVQDTNAMMRIPGNTPAPVMIKDGMPSATPKVTPRATVKPGTMKMY